MFNKIYFISSDTVGEDIFPAMADTAAQIDLSSQLYGARELSDATPSFLALGRASRGLEGNL